MAAARPTAWENGFHANGLLIHGRDTPARIVKFLRAKGLVASPYLVDIISEYGYRVEPVGVDADSPV